MCSWAIPLKLVSEHILIPINLVVALNSSVHHHQFDNGLILLAEPMDWVESAAFTWLMPAGCIHEPADRLGLAALTTEMVQRGCGPWSSRQVMQHLDNLGIVRSAGASLMHTQLGGAMPRERLPDALAAFSEIVRNPHLPADQLEDARQGCLHDIQGIQDDPTRLLLQSLRQQHFPAPLGRNSSGTLETVQAISHDDVVNYHARHFQPQDSILAVAGNIEWEAVVDQTATLLADWQPVAVDAPTVAGHADGSMHIEHPSSQTHIGIAFESIPYSHDDYFQLRAAIGVLSDGMSSRLFTEVRENRGLCYAIFASCQSLRDRGSVFTYAGTTQQRAQETLDVTIEQLQQLANGIQPEELDRLRARLKSGLIMQQESSSSRSASIASDWYYLQRVRSLDELNSILDELSSDSINAYLSDHSPDNFDVVTLGQHPLEITSAVS